MAATSLVGAALALEVVGVGVGIGTARSQPASGIETCTDDH